MARRGPAPDAPGGLSLWGLPKDGLCVLGTGGGHRWLAAEGRRGLETPGVEAASSSCGPHGPPRTAEGLCTHGTRPRRSSESQPASPSVLGPSCPAWAESWGANVVAAALPFEVGGRPQGVTVRKPGPSHASPSVVKGRSRPVSAAETQAPALPSRWSQWPWAPPPAPGAGTTRVGVELRPVL